MSELTPEQRTQAIADARSLYRLAGGTADPRSPARRSSVISALAGILGCTRGDAVAMLDDNDDCPPQGIERPAPEPRFKPGDRVRHIKSGSLGYVTDVTKVPSYGAGGLIRVQTSTGREPFTWYGENVEPAPLKVGDRVQLGTSDFGVITSAASATIIFDGAGQHAHQRVHDDWRLWPTDKRNFRKLRNAMALAQRVCAIEDDQLSQQGKLNDWGPPTGYCPACGSAGDQPCVNMRGERFAEGAWHRVRG